MSFFRWLYRLPGRINRSFASTAVATNVEQGELNAWTNAVGARVVAQEIENDATSETTSGEGDHQDADPEA